VFKNAAIFCAKSFIRFGFVSHSHAIKTSQLR
jgi:hypothetical protein